MTLDDVPPIAHGVACSVDDRIVLARAGATVFAVGDGGARRA